MKNDVSRREVLGLIGAGTASIAGCSQSEPASTPEGSEDSTSQSEDETTEQTDTSTQEGEVSLEGEEDFEQYLSSSIEGDGAGKPAYNWIEFESPGSQIDLPLPDGLPKGEILRYNIEEGMRGEGVGEFDSLYLAIERDYDGEGPDVTQYFFIEDEWDSTLSAEENMQEANGRLGSPSYEETDLGVLETLLSENVEGYSEVSDDLPEEYQEWLDS